jgi:hypothetical protein
MRALAATVPEPSIAWTRLKLESGWALVEGDLQASEQWAIQAYQVAAAAGEPDAETSFHGQISRVLYFQGRYGEVLDRMLVGASEPNSLASWRAAAAMALVERDREDEAREQLLAADLQGVRSDETWLMSVLHWAEVCSRLRVVECAGELYALLAPYSGQFVAGGTIVSGPSDLVLATLAAILERHDAAERHFAATTEITERLGAPLFLAHTHANWARALIARSRAEDRDRAQSMLEQAEETAGRLGAGLVTREVAECRAALAATGG